MSQYPHYGNPAQPHYGHWPAQPPHYPNPQTQGYTASSARPQYSYVPVMVPMPVPAVPVATTPVVGTPVPAPSAPPYVVEVPQTQQPGPTSTTNYIYHGESSSSPKDQMEYGTSEEYDWVPTPTNSANYLSGKAFVAGHISFDGTPLWIIRGWHNGDYIPGKYSLGQNMATIAYNGKEIPVQNIEVLTAKPSSLRWVQASNGRVPPGAILGGRTASGETLYVGRVKYHNSFIPGKVHPSHSACYVGFNGEEKPHKVYDVLCTAQKHNHHRRHRLKCRATSCDERRHCH